MEYDKHKPEKDFVLRTIELAHELQSHRYNTTLQVNLLFGSVIFTKACWYSRWGHYSTNCNDIGGVKIIYRQESVSWQVLLHCLRNGVVHWGERDNKNVVFEQNEDGAIIRLTIKGDGNVLRTPEGVQIVFDLEQNGILNFMTKIAELIKGFA